MTAFDEPLALNRDALINLIYALQTDLRMLTEQLAREHEPDVPDRTLLNLYVLQDHLHQAMPSLNRH